MIYESIINRRDNLRKCTSLIFSIICVCFQANAQSHEGSEYFKISATRFSLPENHTGLTDPAFVIWGKFTKTSLGDKYYLYLTVRFEHSTADNPNPSFWYSYKNSDGKLYTDKEIGTEPFKSITFYGALFAARVNYGAHRVDINLEGQEIPRRIGEVSKDFHVKSASVHIDRLTRYNIDAPAIRNAIANYENGIKKKEDDAKKVKEAEERKKQEETQKPAQGEEDLNTQATTLSNDNHGSVTKDTDDFWSDSRTRTNSRTSNDENLRGASQFGGGLDDIKEGDYFKDDKGNFYKKEKGNARVVSQSEYDRAQANKIQEQFAQQEQRRQEKMLVVDRAIDAGLDVLTTSFYAQQLSRNMKDATTLGSGFSSIEELNATFSQKMQEITYLSQELRTTSERNMNTYISSQLASSNSASEQAVVSAVGILGSVAISISSANEERKAREDLAAQRAAAETEIKERQRVALVNIRNEISKMFPEGGMPLSTHKIDAPLIYVFAYSTDEKNWEKDQEIPLTVSNVIPVYRYSDGTYPYTSNVKRTFENGGVNKPILIGYFTDRTEAEKYRNSLVDVAPNAKLAVNDIEIKVKEQNTNAIQNSNNDTDFWGNKNTDAKKNNTETELDFWGMPVKKKGTETKKNEQKKQDDFWSN